MYMHAGHGAATFINLPTGADVVANFEGAVNDTTLMCNVTDDMLNIQIPTTWSVRNFRGVSASQLVGSADPQNNIFLISGDIRPEGNIPLDNRITILNWTVIVDGVDLLCGTGSVRDLADVTLRIYSKFSKVSMSRGTYPHAVL